MLTRRLRLAAKLLSRKGLSHFLTEEMMRLERGAYVLNVGAGGDIQKIVDGMAAKRGIAVINTDVDPARVPDVVDDIMQSSFPSETFDAVIIMEVLEHVPEPHRAALEIHRLLKPGGRLIASTPFLFPIHDRPYDYFRYTRYGLVYLFRNFTDLEVRERNSWAEAVLVLIARLPMEHGRSFRVASPFFIFAAYVLSPFAILATAIFPSDFFTTGYVVSGAKRGLVAD